MLAISEFMLSPHLTSLVSLGRRYSWVELLWVLVEPHESRGEYERAPQQFAKQA